MTTDVLEASLALAHFHFTAATSFWPWIAVITAALSFWRITAVASRSDQQSKASLPEPAIQFETAGHLPHAAVSADPSLPRSPPPRQVASTADDFASRSMSTARACSTSCSGHRLATKGKLRICYEDEGVQAALDDGDADGAISFYSREVASTANDVGSRSMLTVGACSSSSSGQRLERKGNLRICYEDEGVQAVVDDGDAEGAISFYSRSTRLPVVKTFDLGWYQHQDLTLLNGSVVRLWDRRICDASPLLTAR